MDKKEINNCKKVTKNIDYVFNMACNMGGMGFIENNKEYAIGIDKHKFTNCM